MGGDYNPPADNPGLSRGLVDIVDRPILVGVLHVGPAGILANEDIDGIHPKYGAANGNRTRGSVAEIYTRCGAFLIGARVNDPKTRVSQMGLFRSAGTPVPHPPLFRTFGLEPFPGSESAKGA